MKVNKTALLAFFLVMSWGAMAQKHTLYIPHFTFKDGLWKTEISLNHTGEDTQEIVVTAYDDSGQEQGIFIRELTPVGGIHGDVTQLMPDLASDVGWLKITTGSAPIQGLVKFSHLINGGSSSLPAVWVPSKDLVFSLLENSSQWNSGFAVVNTSDFEATLQLSLYSFDGNLVQTVNRVLSPNSKLVTMLDEIFQENLPAAGFLELHSSQDVVALALTFSQNLDQIVAVPAALSAQGVTDERTQSRQLVELTAGNNALAVGLFHSLSAESDNVFFSPYSISTALAMAFAGARNQTAKDMADSLHFTLAPESVHIAFSNLNETLSQRGKNSSGRDGEGFRLNITQSLWGQTGYPFLSEFLQLLGDYYGAPAQWLDFSSDPDGSRTIINDWVADQTEDRIQDLLPPGIIDALTRLVLVNTIYFNAAWAFPFPEEATTDSVFHLLDGGSTDVAMMVANPEVLLHVDTQSYQGVQIPYDGNELAMVVVVPKEGFFDSFHDSLTVGMLASIVASMEPTDVTLEFPKFQYASDSVSLKDVLSDLGMSRAFSGAADFSGIDGDLNLYISDVIHKTFLSVDEAGTEAAAATGVVFRETATPTPKQVRVDRPFLFWIQDLETQTILFLGRIVNPAS